MKIHNTLTRTKEEFVPLAPGESPHVRVRGHRLRPLAHRARAQRHRLRRDPPVPHLRGIPGDVRQELHRRRRSHHPARPGRRRAARPRSPSATSTAYRADMEALGVLAPDVEPKATEHVPQMIELIERLLASGWPTRSTATCTSRCRRFPAYGKLSGKNLDELLAGARVEVDERKRDPRDFALWKAAKPGEPSWDSPWGPGRPGLAHRVLRHGDAVPRRVLRHPRRRRGSDLPAPRVRDRPVRGGDRQALRALLDRTTASSTWARRRCRSRSATR